MGQLLYTGQVDSFLIWEPVVSNAELSSIGKCIAVPSDLPSPGKWNNQAIDVIILRNDFIQDNPNTPRPVIVSDNSSDNPYLGGHGTGREYSRSLGLWK